MKNTLQIARRLSTQNNLPDDVFSWRGGEDTPANEENFLRTNRRTMETSRVNHLDQTELSGNMWYAGKILHLRDINEFVQLLDQLGDGGFGARDDHAYSGDPLVQRRPDS